MPLRLYTDECVNGHVVSGLRRRSVDLRTALEERLLTAGDPAHLDRAIALDRTLVTEDDDFLPLVAKLLDEGKEFPGLIFIEPGTPVGKALGTIVILAETTEPDAMRNQTRWVS